MAQSLSTPDPSLSPTHLSIRIGRATTTHYTHHQVSLMMSRNTTLVPSLGLCIGVRREHVPPRQRKKERKKEVLISQHNSLILCLVRRPLKQTNPLNECPLSTIRPLGHNHDRPLPIAYTYVGHNSLSGRPFADSN